MQDRFNFRIWDITNERWDKTYSLSHYLNVVVNYENSVVIQQCLGVKDKTGRLIYEGDVVKYLPIHEEVILSNISEVIYSNACFLTKNIRVGKCKRYSNKHIKWFKEKHNEDVSNEVEFFSPTDEYGTDWADVEIIGSIAEDKLLNLEGNVISTLTTIEDTLKHLGV